MPDLDILDEHGRLLRGNHAGIRVLATMLYPKDAEKREAHIAAVRYESLLSEQPPQAIPPDIARLVFDHGGSGIRKRGEGTLAHALLAGEVLLAILQLSEHAPEHASFRKALRHLEDWRQPIKKKEKMGFPASVASMENAWRDFKSVSHLWAAFIPLWKAGEGDQDPLQDEALPEFLGDARWFADAAFRHYPAGAGCKARPVLEPGEIWTIPNSEDIPEVTLVAPALSDVERALLARYRYDR